MQPSDALTLEYKRNHGRARRDLNVFDLVNDPDANGVCRVFGLGLAKEGLDLRGVKIRALFDQLAATTKLKSLGLVEPLDWASMTLNRVDRTVFFSTFDEGHAVQYFYEPFLQQFDPELRKELGVWYTPPEVVKYMVARVDAELRQELGIADGLADPRVYVLDPCCGTGA